MLLVGVKENNHWLSSQWNLTYRTGWQGICKAVAATYDFYDRPEILLSKVVGAPGEVLTNITSKDDILKIEEGSSLTIRGISKVIKVPLMMSMFNQTNVVTVSVPATGEEFSETNYEKFNKSLCQYLSSVELLMYKP